MFYRFFVLFVFLKTVSSQINGEFWWLNEKLAQLQQVEPPAPQFEDIGEYETDESVKIIFNDNEMLGENLNENQDISLSKDEIPPGFIHFNLAKPEFVGKEIVIGKKNLTNTSDEEFKINFSSSNKQVIEDSQSSSGNIRNSTKNIKKYLLKRPSKIFYKLGKPVAIKNNALNNNNKIFFTQTDEDENKQFVLPDFNKDSQKINKTKTNGDEFKFVFPVDNEDFWNRKPVSEGNANNILNSTSTSSDLNISGNFNKISMVNKTVYSGKIAISDKIAFDEDKPPIETESICTFITKYECLRNKGTIHMTGLCPMNSFHDYHRICCILPLSSNSKYRNRLNRYKRSDNTDLSQALKQRNALLQRKNFSQTLKNNQDDTTTHSNLQKIVTPGDYGDPYWNVKNFKFRQQTEFNTNKDYDNTKYDSFNKDYSVDYTAEVPKPGLLGLHSEQEERLTTWKKRNKGYSYDGYDEVSEEDSGESDLPFGYPMFDPRQGNRKKNSRSKKRKPQRLMVTSAEENKGSESQTINFHSSPDFHVLHGFKLVNLSGNKNRFVRTTTETLCDNQDTSSENTFSEVENPDDIYDTIDLDQQVYKDCGTTTHSLDGNFKKASEETNPWLALVVLTKSPQTILCYATIVHPRAVITAAECVHGKIPGDVTVLTGVWNLRKDKAKPQQRMASVHIQSDFKPGELANDLALLYWKRPFQLEASIQPACLSDPHVGDECYFVGWGGYDQALRHRPNSQQARILTPRACNEKLSAPELVLPPGAFCAAVESRGTVTGIGGPLLCKAGSRRVSVVGVAVYREDVVILLPTFEWVASALRDHKII